MGRGAYDTSMPLTPPSPPPNPCYLYNCPCGATAQDYGVQDTTVQFGQSRKAIKAYHASLKRENATLSENKENIPPTNDKEADPQHDLGKKEG